MLHCMHGPCLFIWCWKSELFYLSALTYGPAVSTGEKLQPLLSPLSRGSLCSGPPGHGVTADNIQGATGLFSTVAAASYIPPAPQHPL